MWTVNIQNIQYLLSFALVRMSFYMFSQRNISWHIQQFLHFLLFGYVSHPLYWFRALGPWICLNSRPFFFPNLCFSFIFSLNVYKTNFTTAMLMLRVAGSGTFWKPAMQSRYKFPHSLWVSSTLRLGEWSHNSETEEYWASRSLKRKKILENLFLCL